MIKSLELLKFLSMVPAFGPLVDFEMCPVLQLDFFDKLSRSHAHVLFLESRGFELKLFGYLHLKYCLYINENSGLFDRYIGK